MDYIYYQNKLNDVIIKSPIEIGVEILVYNILDNNIKFDLYSLIDISKLQKKSDKRLTTKAGVSDIAIVSPNFIFKKECSGKVYGFVEVKTVGKSLRETYQFIGQVEDARHFIYTNGIVWRYYYKSKLIWEINLSAENVPYSLSEIQIDKEKFIKLNNEIKAINWQMI